MNREQYLKSLDQLLSSLPYNERRDIMFDYEEHFIEGIKEGLSEEDISRSLSTPESIASKYVTTPTPLIEVEEDNTHIDNNSTVLPNKTAIDSVITTKSTIDYVVPNKPTIETPIPNKAQQTIQKPAESRKKANNPLAMLLIIFALLILFSFVIGPYVVFWSLVIVFFAVSIVFLFSGFTIFISTIVSMPLAIFNIPVELLDHPIFLLSGSVFLVSLGGLFLIITYYFGKGLIYLGFYYIRWCFRTIRGY
ncbi:MAG: DUF1700 domain-containing protein [Vallitaleaceae bacterium]|jgi:uncharacterized membrane protein|nr:DUF1700 domain-containing protein [Vallitaleaceae bacterium]